MELEDVTRIREALLALRDSLIEEGAAKVRVEPEVPVAAGADEDEAPYREMDQSIASARNRERAKTLVRIEAALVRLAETPDEYGLCDKCDEPIATGRLLALPFATRCAPCQAGNEERLARGRKKVTDYR